MEVDKTLEIRFVVKKDRHVAIFEHEKLIRSIYGALESSGAPDMLLAGHLAELTECILAQEYPGGRVRAKQIADMVCHVLEEAEMPRVSHYFSHYQMRREFVRSQIEVRCNLQQGDLFQQSESILGQESHPWDKAVIYRDLLKKDLDPRLCERICNGVEKQVIDSGVRSISKAMIGEWVSNALVLAEQGEGMFRR